MRATKGRPDNRPSLFLLTMNRYKPTLGDRIAMKLFNHEVIYETDCEGYKAGNFGNAEPYLIRYFVWNDNKGLIKKAHIYLHHIIKSDPDREHHDHPWDFYSFLFWGGYWEETPLQAKSFQHAEDIVYLMKERKAKAVRYEDGTYGVRKWYHPINFLVRPAEWAHRLYLDKPAWSLVYTTKKRREWGFHSIIGWIHNNIFLDYKCKTPE